MKKHLLYAGLFVAALSSCSDDKDRVSQPNAEMTPDREEIKLTVSNNENFSVETRGTGMVGGLTAKDNVWKGQDLYILMTQTGTVTPVVPDYKYNGLGTHILNNVKVTAPTNKVSGLVTGNDGAVTPAVGHHYYYPINGMFDFYGYHVDDACGYKDGVKVEPQLAGTDSKTLNVVIDGSQDLMVAKADFAADDLDIEELAGKSYSAYAARRDVQPMLNFKHLLSQLQFEVKNMGDNNLSVDSIGIKSVHKGTMTVAGANYGNIDWSRAEGDTTKLYVKVDYADNDALLDSLAEVELPTKTNNTTGAYTKIGNLLVPASKEDSLITDYEGEIKLIQTLKATVTEGSALVDKDVTAYSTIPFRISLTNASTPNFVAGYAYTVKINVYGLSKIGVTANLTQWSNGGSFEVTPEDQVTDGKEAIFNASTIQRAWVVKDQASYANVPESYRTQLGQWGTNGLSASLPWLLVAVTPHDASQIIFTVKKSEGESREFNWSWSAEKSFFTISQEELNEGQSEKWEFTDGSTWTIVVDGEEVELTI